MPKNSKMNIEKLQSVYQGIVNKINSNPQKALAYFNVEWANLTFPEKEVLRIFLERYHEIVLKENELPLINQFYLSEIYVNTDLELEGESSNGIIMLDSRVKDIQIAKLFNELKNRGYILNTIEDLGVCRRPLIPVS